MTPTARTLTALRSAGFCAEVVEKWIPRLNVRKDYLGVVDVLAIKAPEPVLAIQVTSGSNLSARRAKCLAEPRLLTWLRCGQRFELHGWAKRGAAGKRKLWQCRIVALTLADFPSAEGSQVSDNPQSVVGSQGSNTMDCTEDSEGSERIVSSDCLVLIEGSRKTGASDITRPKNGSELFGGTETAICGTLAAGMTESTSGERKRGTVQL